MSPNLLTRLPAKSGSDGWLTKRGPEMPPGGSRLLASEPTERGTLLRVTTGRGTGNLDGRLEKSPCPAPEHELKRLNSLLDGVTEWLAEHRVAATSIAIGLALVVPSWVAPFFDLVLEVM